MIADRRHAAGASRWLRGERSGIVEGLRFVHVHATIRESGASTILTGRCSIASRRAPSSRPKEGYSHCGDTQAEDRLSTRPEPTPNQTQRPGAGPEPYVRPTVATIDLTAGSGRAGLSVGDRVRISGSGLYAGEAAVIEKLTSGVIPAALVRTEAGRTRQVRTIDLEPIAREA